VIGDLNHEIKLRPSNRFSVYPLVDKPSVDSDEVAYGVVLDFGSDGALVGIDVQHASKNADIESLA
jgi:hypothetical protein